MAEAVPFENAVMKGSLQTMQQVWITRHGPPDVLELREAAVPQPSNGEVLIRVAAAGINFADIMARLGLYPDAPKPPCVVGYEVAGEVAALGPSATAFAVGDKVIALTRFGGYSSHVSVRQEQVFELHDPRLDEPDPGLADCREDHADSRSFIRVCGSCGGASSYRGSRQHRQSRTPAVSSGAQKPGDFPAPSQHRQGMITILAPSSCFAFATARDRNLNSSPYDIRW
jgi:Alcohol dehydrogenase GroES-like domain